MKFDVNYVVCDTETGGLIASKTALVEVACYAFNQRLEDLSDYTSLIAPYDNTKEYTDGALKANGLTIDKIKGGRDSKIVIEELCNYFKSIKISKNKPILCGHNLDFDISFLDEFFKFHKRDIWEYINSDIRIDTMWWSRMCWLESVNYKLGTCCENAGIELINAHRAVTDTIANKELVKYFLKNIRTVSNNSEMTFIKFRDSFQF